MSEDFILDIGLEAHDEGTLNLIIEGLKKIGAEQLIVEKRQKKVKGELKEFSNIKIGNLTKDVQELALQLVKASQNAGFTKLTKQVQNYGKAAKQSKRDIEELARASQLASLLNSSNNVSKKASDYINWFDTRNRHNIDSKSPSNFKPQHIEKLEDTINKLKEQKNLLTSSLSDFTKRGQKKELNNAIAKLEKDVSSATKALSLFLGYEQKLTDEAKKAETEIRKQTAAEEKRINAENKSKATERRQEYIRTFKHLLKEQDKNEVALNREVKAIEATIVAREKAIQKANELAEKNRRIAAEQKKAAADRSYVNLWKELLNEADKLKTQQDKIAEHNKKKINEEFKARQTYMSWWENELRKIDVLNKKVEETRQKNLKNLVTQFDKKDQDHRDRVRQDELNNLNARMAKNLALLKDVKHEVDKTVSSYKRLHAGAQTFGYAIRRGLYDLSHMRHAINLAFSFAGVYAAVNAFQRIFDIASNAVKKSIEFNDEVQRSKTIFTGLGILGTNKSIGQIEMGGTDKERAQLGKAQDFSSSLTSRLMTVAAQTGQEFSTVIGAAKSFIPDMIDKMKKVNPKQANALIANPKVFQDTVEQLVKLSAVVKMTDPRDKQLSYFTYAFNELLAGTSGGKKDTGKEAVKSFRARFGINIRPEEALPIAKAVNSGDFPKFVQLLTARLERAGISVNKLSDLMERTLHPNVQGAIAAFRILGAQFTNPLYKRAIAFFSVLREELAKLTQDKRFMDMLTRAGELFKNKFKAVTDIFGDFFDKIKNPDVLEAKLNNAIETLANIRDVAIEFSSVVMAFLSGLTGISGDEVTTFDNLIETLHETIEPAKELGETLRAFAELTAPTIKLFNLIANGIMFWIDLAKQFASFAGSHWKDPEQKDYEYDQRYKLGMTDEEVKRHGDALAAANAARQRAQNALKYSQTKLPSLGYSPIGGIGNALDGKVNPFYSSIAKNPQGQMNRTIPQPINNVFQPKIVMPKQMEQRPQRTITGNTIVQNLNVNTNANNVSEIIKDAKVRDRTPLEMLDAIRGINGGRY